MTTSSEASVMQTPAIYTMATTSMMGLKPPGSLTNLSAEGFKKWKQLFEIYRIASGAGTMPSAVQVALLLHCIGESCIDIYNTFTYEKDDDKDNYDIVLNKFEAHFVPVKNESVNSTFSLLGINFKMKVLMHT